MSEKRIELHPQKCNSGWYWWTADDIDSRPSRALCCDITIEYFCGLKKTKPIILVISEKPHLEAYKVRSTFGGIEIDCEDGTETEWETLFEPMGDFVGPNWVYLSIEVPV